MQPQTCKSTSNPAKPSRRSLANAIRMLSVDAIQQANSGHPGMPMGMADIAQVLWQDFLKFNPNNANWWDRDRFVVSNGHGSMLLYALLHLTGFPLTLDDLKQFRQWHSKTPGHPEFHHTVGVECTTGPLGQGLGYAVGMALAERHLATHFNRPDFDIINHFTYVFCGDGCLMEGISHEACALAGTLKLGKLIVFWDSNRISIDGEVDGWCQDDTPSRFRAYQWHVIGEVDGHDPEQIRRAIQEAQAVTDRPSFIACNTQIGFGSPSFAGSARAHGEPMGTEETARIRTQLQWPYQPFEVPADIREAWDARERGAAMQQQWQQLWDGYQQAHPALAQELKRRLTRQLPAHWQELVETLKMETLANKQNQGTRKHSGFCLERIAPHLPELLGGSADLTPSNNTLWKNAPILDATHPEGRYLHYGVREFGMATVMNGMSLHGGIIPYAGTFLTFVDYARNATRMAALMKIPVIFVFTHDSIGLGEDGPTHQPVEHLTMLRTTPHMQVWRPANAYETAIAWQCAIERNDGPSSLIFSRQNVPTISTPEVHAAAVQQGAYVIFEPTIAVSGILLATGSEVPLAVAAAEQLQQLGQGWRVVSMPCCERFKALPQTLRENILPNNIKKRLAIEAGHPDYWYQFVGLEGRILGVAEYGASAPGEEVLEKYGFHVKNVIALAQEMT